MDIAYKVQDLKTGLFYRKKSYGGYTFVEGSRGTIFKRRSDLTLALREGILGQAFKEHPKLVVVCYELFSTDVLDLSKWER